MGQCLPATPQPSSHLQHLGGPPHPQKPCTVWKLPRDLHIHGTWERPACPGGVGAAWGGVGVCASVGGHRVLWGGHRGRPHPGTGGSA